MRKKTPLLAERMHLLPSYIFKEIDTLKAARLAGGKKVIDLAMGNPIDPTPGRVINTLCSHIQNPDNHRYPDSSGMSDLKEEITRWYENEYNLQLDREKEVICTIGSKEGISHLLLALLDAKDHILVPSPSFPIHAFGAVIAGARVQKVPVADENIFLETVEKACKQNKCSLVILNFPHNPTGKVVSLDFFNRMISLAGRYGFFIIHDFAYGKVTFDNFKAPSFLQAEGALDVGVEFSTFSKTFNMAGWRIGYCVGNKEMIASLGKIKGYFDYGIFSPIQFAGITALKECEKEVKEQVERYQKRRDIVFNTLKGAGYEVEKPGGGMFCWSKIPPSFAEKGSQFFVRELFDKTGILVTPGRAFGDEADQCIRIALVQEKKTIAEAMEHMVTEFPGET